MAVPKKKVTRGRRDRRRFSSFNRITKPTVAKCPECHEVKRPHAVCSCGFYKGKSVVEVRVKEAV